MKKVFRGWGIVIDGRSKMQTFFSTKERTFAICRVEQRGG